MTAWETFIEMFGAGAVLAADIRAICRYDPQRLLPDKRTVLQKYATQAVEDYRKMHPDLMTAWDRSVPRIPHLFPGENLQFADEIDLTRKRVPTFMPVDFGRLEARVFPERKIPSYEINMKDITDAMGRAGESAARFARMMKEQQRLLAAAIDQRLFETMMGVFVDTPAREQRILRLKHSDDPRQRKRGRRLYAAMKKERLAVEYGGAVTGRWTGGRMDPPWHYPKSEERLRKFYNTEIGEPYDPDRYRKD